MMASQLNNTILDISRRFLVHPKRWLSFAADSSPSPPPIRFISRRLFLQYQEHIKRKASKSGSSNTKQNVKIDETPWPRNIVYGTYVVMAFSIPYSIAWFLSSNAPLRTVIFPSINDCKSTSSDVLEWMRYHFGVPDYESISEPEVLAISLSNQRIPHKFVDEPTKRIRQQQLSIDHQHQQNVKFRLISGMSNEDLVTLPATTLARYDDLSKALSNTPIVPPIALNFIDCDDEEVVHDSLSDPVFDERTSSSTSSSSSILSDNTITVPSMSIYSLWHYQPPKLDGDDGKNKSNNKNPVHSMSPMDIELSRIQYEIDLLRQELKQSSHMRPIDDIQDELTKLQSLKRRYVWKKWLSFW